MRTKNFLKHLMLGATFLTAGNVVGQSTTPGNVANLNTDFLGWNTNAANNFPLVVKHELNQPIQFRTDNVLRMRLMETLTGQTIGSYTNETLSGNLGLGVFGGTVARPFSMIHLNNGGTQFSGYRPWHRAGMTITQGSDLGWIGLKNEGGDLNHFTIAWADNTAVDGPDLFKFIFLANPGSTGTAGSLNGLEAMRIRPRANGLESFVGIGDWFTTGSNINPTERLDLLDGRLRIRQLPDDAEADAEYKVMVVDDTNDPNERGVVKWRSINLNAGCDWVVQDQFPFTPPHVSNTYDNSNCTGDRRHGVGIGVPIPKSKLYVYHWDNSLLSPTAITADARFDLTNAQQLYGLYSQARPSSSTTTIQNQQATGAFGQAINSRSSVGVHGFGSTCTASSGTASEVIGLRGAATGCERAVFVAGLYGEGSGSQNGTNHWGAYINGPGYITQGPWQPSDEQLKTDIQPYGSVGNAGEGAADVSASNPVLSLPVHRYQYNASAFPSLNLPSGEQVGFLAGELEALLPSAV